MKTLFKNATILDCSGAEPFLGNVLVNDNRIESITDIESDADVDAVIDCTGKFLMPGLIESHAHLSIDNTDSLTAIGMVPPEENTLIAARNARYYLDCGITSCISAAAAKPRLDVVIRNACLLYTSPSPRD